MPSRRERTLKNRLLFCCCCGSDLLSGGNQLACHLAVGRECSAISHTAHPEVSSGRVCGIISRTHHCVSLNENVKTYFPCIYFIWQVTPVASRSGTNKIIATRPQQNRLRQLIIKLLWSKSNHSKHMAHKQTDSQLAEKEMLLSGSSAVMRSKILVQMFYSFENFSCFHSHWFSLSVCGTPSFVSNSIYPKDLDPQLVIRHRNQLL